MKQLCQATVVIAARRLIQKLEVTKLELTHNHEVSEDMYQTYPESRRLTAEEREFVQPLVELNVPPSKIAERLNENTGKSLQWS